MFDKNTNHTNLQKEIDKVLAEMEHVASDSPEYAKMADQLDKLYKMKATDRPDRVSKDALIAVIGNIAGIVAIIGHERVHVITSKALGFVPKFKL